MAVSPQLQALLSELEKTDLEILAKELLPALAEEIEALSPANVQPTEVMIFGVLMPTMQTALAALIAKVP